MWPAIVILCLGIPAAVGLSIAVEEYAVAGRRISRNSLLQRCGAVFETGVLSEPNTTWNHLVGALRLFAWTSALGCVIAEMFHAWPASGGLALWWVAGCGALELARYLPGGEQRPDVPALLDTTIVWLAFVAAMAGLGCLYGTFNLAAITAAQARSGFWAAALQPFGFAVFMLAALTFSGVGRARPRDVELTERVTALVWACLAVILYGGGWHFWGISTYTTGEEVLFFRAVWQFVVVAVKVAVLLCAWAYLRSKCAAGNGPVIAGTVLLAAAGANFVVALAAETWIRPGDDMTRGLLSWIVAGGATAYGLMFHREQAIALFKGLVGDDTNSG